MELLGEIFIHESSRILLVFIRGLFKKKSLAIARLFVFSGDFINLRLSCFLRKLSRVLFERQLELERILRIPL